MYKTIFSAIAAGAIAINIETETQNVNIGSDLTKIGGVAAAVGGVAAAVGLAAAADVIAIARSSDSDGTTTPGPALDCSDFPDLKVDCFAPGEGCGVDDMITPAPFVDETKCQGCLLQEGVINPPGSTAPQTNCFKCAAEGKNATNSFCVIVKNLPGCGVAIDPTDYGC